MLISDFDFDLPEELIASYPLEKRDQSRLLHYNLESKSIQHKKFQDISQILNSGDILVRNVSRVLAARLYLYNPRVRVVLVLFVWVTLKRQKKK